MNLIDSPQSGDTRQKRIHCIDRCILTYLSLPTSFGDALAQARGLGVAYTVAHQYRGQLPPDIKAGIDANCRNKIIFGLNSDDAKDMAAEAPELLPLDFMTLPRYKIYTAFQSGGRSTG